MASFTAAGTAYANYGVEMIPFFIYYSMFGFQRVGDLIWAFADSRGKGFLMGGTAGRTTLAGEGLQHQDGHSHVLASTVPTCAAYDPAYAYEIAVIVQDGIRRMYQEQEDLFYYLTLYNENYPMPPMPDGARPEGILKGIYRYPGRAGGQGGVQLFGSGPILNEALRRRDPGRAYGVAADVWSVTSYNELRRDALAVERWNRLHPDQPPRGRTWWQRSMAPKGPIVAATDYMKVVPTSGAVAARPHGDAGYRRLRAQRQSRTPAPPLRSERRIHRDGGAFTAGARQPARWRESQSRNSAELGVDTEKVDAARA